MAFFRRGYCGGLSGQRGLGSEGIFSGVCGGGGGLWSGDGEPEDFVCAGASGSFGFGFVVFGLIE